MRILAPVILFLMMLPATKSWAACTSPAGVDGQLMWITADVQYCAGTVWRTLNNTVSGTGCTTIGAIQFVSSQIMWCNGTNWVQTAPVLDYGACAAAGNFYYDTGGQYYWFCTGSFWRRMGP